MLNKEKTFITINVSMCVPVCVLVQVETTSHFSLASHLHINTVNMTFPTCVPLCTSPERHTNLVDVPFSCGMMFLFKKTEKQVTTIITNETQVTSLVICNNNSHTTSLPTLPTLSTFVIVSHFHVFLPFYSLNTTTIAPEHTKCN